MIVAPVVLTAVRACAGGAALAVRMRDADLPSAQRMGIGRCRRQRDGPDRRFCVGERIYARSQDGRLEPLEEQVFATEDDLQARNAVSRRTQPSRAGRGETGAWACLVRVERAAI